jgi:hypothetical protein
MRNHSVAAQTSVCTELHFEKRRQALTKALEHPLNNFGAVADNMQAKQLEKQ